MMVYGIVLLVNDIMAPGKLTLGDRFGNLGQTAVADLSLDDAMRCSFQDRL